MATIETIRRIRVQTLAEGGDAARRDLLATADATAKLSQASGASAVVIDLAARKQLSANAAFEKARIQVDALYAAQVRYDRQLQALNRGFEQGEKSLEDYNTALELAKMKYDAAVASATKYQATQRALAQESIAAAKAQEQQAEAYQKSLNARLGVGASAGASRGGDIEAAFASADRLRAKYDELFAASQKYQAARTEITDANRAGILADNIAAQAIQKVTQAYRDQVSVIENVARAAKESAQRAVNQQTVPARNRGADIDAYGQELDRRRAQYDEVFAAGQKYRAGLAQLREDLAVGAIGEGLYTTELEKRKAAFAEQINALGNYSKAQRDAAQAAQDAAAAQQAADGKRAAVQMVAAQTVPARDRKADVEAAFAEQSKMREALVPRAKAERELADALKQVDEASRVGAFANSDERTAAIDRANARFHDQVNELDKANLAHKRLANGAGLSAYAYQNLGYQVNDVVTSLAAGISPMQTFAQQGGQILQVLQMGDGGIAGALKGIGTTSLNFVRGIGLAGGAAGLLATTLIAGGVAAYSFSQKTVELNRQLQGLGQASGATVSQIDALADSSASAAGVSIREFRSMAGSFAATGEIGTEMYTGLAKAAKDFSRASGQDLTTVAGELGVAFAEPGKGADDLNKKLLILNATQLESIKRMEAQGNTLGAQKALLDAYNAGIDKTGQSTSGWGRIMTDAGNLVSDAWTKAGAAIDKVLNGGSLEQQLESARKVLAESQELQTSMPGRFFGGLFGQDPEKDAAQVKKIEDLIKRRDDGIKKAQANKDSNKAGDLLKGLSPSEESIKRLEDGATMLESKMGSIGLDKQGEAKRAIEYMRDQAAKMREDLEKGGANFAQALKDAQFNNKMVGATGFGLDRATTNKQYDDQIEALRSNKSVDVASDAFKAQVATIEATRKAALDTLDKATTLSNNKIGGAFSQMSSEVQAQLLQGSARFPRVPVEISAAIAKMESGGNLDVGYTKIKDENGKTGTAYGLGQVTRSTGDDLSQKYGIDRMDKSTAGTALAGVINMKLDAVGGDIDKAIMAYRGSKDPAVNRAYLAEVKKNAGQMGDPSVAAQASGQDNLSRSTRDATEELKRQTDLYGVNTEKLNTQAAAQSAYNRLIDAGMPANEEFRKSLMGIAAAAEAAARDTKLVQFQRDQTFARDQLGRTDQQQSAFSTARQMYGDVNDPRAKTVIEESLKTSDLLETKNMIKEGTTSFLSEIRRTGDALGALSNVFMNIADKIASKAIDSVISNAFGSMGSSNGGGGFLSSLFGGGGSGGIDVGATSWMPKFAGGGVMNGPSIAGESGPEAAVPLPDGRRIPVMLSQPANTNVQQPANMNVEIHNSVSDKADVQATQKPDGSLVIDMVDKGLAKKAGQRRSSYQAALAAPLRG